MIEFKAWPKIARLNRDVVITEKIDGTNAAVIVDEDGVTVGAQSRNRLITPDQDNAGFAAWVYANAAGLADVLGPGHHFGEWWGSGIQRGYGLKKGERWFSLFNTSRWDDQYDHEKWEPLGLGIVPILYEGPFSELFVSRSLAELKHGGSLANHGFMNPEGIVLYHKAANQMFKVTLEGDAAPKALALAKPLVVASWPVALAA